MISLASDLNSARDENASLRSQLDSTARELASARDVNSSQHAQLVSVGGELSSARDVNAALHAQLTSVGNELTEARNVNDSQYAQLESVGQELAIERRRNLALEAMLDGGKQSDDAPSARNNRQPSVILNGLPKSASTYCFETLRRAGNYHEGMISTGIFPHDILAWRRFEAFAAGGQIAHHHLDASAANLWMLNRWPTRLVLHVRDPRQTLVSWRHHLTRYDKDESRTLTAASPPRTWYGLPVSEQHDWLIEHHLPLFVRWIEDWVAAIDEGKVDALITTFEDMVTEPKPFFETLARHCGLEGEVVPPDPRSDTTFLFRAGRIDEWKETFTPSQIDRVNRAMPARLLERFQWAS